MMIELFVMGGPLFMGLITLILMAGITMTIFTFVRLKSTGEFTVQHLSMPDLIRHIGILALVVGFLGQMIGLFSAFQAIEQVGTVSPALLAGGLKVSSITTIYGIISFCICYLAYFGLNVLVKENKA